MALGNAVKNLKREAARTKKSTSIESAAIFCSRYMDVDARMKDAEAELKDLKPTLAQLVPQKGSIKKAEYEGYYKGREGKFTVTRIEQDRRSISNKLLTELVIKKGLTEALSPTADDAKVAELLAVGKITQDEFASCLVGSTIKYNKCDFEST
jgi:hypothetical protein